MNRPPKRLCFAVILAFLALQPTATGQTANPNQALTDSLAKILDWPAGIQVDYFVGPELTPSPACLAVAPSGEVFVGVDMIGSLGKEMGRGRIIRLEDPDRDGVVDDHTVYAEVDNPRGLLPIGNQLFVLYTTFSAETGIATGMDLVVFEDADQDGLADGPPSPLIQNISSAKFLQDRGTDHSTNGIRMGIDGWIYIAVGDFGFHDAVDRDGTVMTMLGGGVLRVRPDGTEMEVYTHGLRNIYDVAIDPFMNIFTRGNTNDGGGWNIRFIHHIQSGEYGYPVLFKHFTDEILPALVDVGGGSGAGALFMDDPNWPDEYNKVPMMADWGRNRVFIHRVEPDRATYTQSEESFFELPQITDLDIDAAGQLFLSAWDGAGYRGDSTIGYVVRAVPDGWSPTPTPDFAGASVEELADWLKSQSAVVRLHAQQELLKRPTDAAAAESWAIASDKDLAPEARVAGIFTYAQVAGPHAISNLVTLVSDRVVREMALRALADRKSWAHFVPLQPFFDGMRDIDPRVRAASIIGLGRLGKMEAAGHLLQVEVPASAVPPATGTEGLHARPNSEIVLAHLAVQSLVSLGAVEAAVAAAIGPDSDLALRALRYMHDERALTGLRTAYGGTDDVELRSRILATISRLYQKEAPYDGSWWWSTRPDTRGPYYKPVTWEGSDIARSFMIDRWVTEGQAVKDHLIELNTRHRMGISEFNGPEEEVAEAEEVVNLGRIANKKGEVGRASIEDVMLAMADIRGDVTKGEEIYTQQACFACHSTKEGETLKGPYLGQVGSIMSRDRIAESILKPNASISQGFASVVIRAKGDRSYAGFISEETADEVTVRNIAGHVFKVKKEDILSREELETSMMPLGLANSLTFEEFTALVDFLAAQK